ncbi:hypothetical protein N7493_002867 [Penicillium malachiteum]|uniref:C4-dicarboxylate transporter/malic acid transport protein n=1 Tax=Penicillium malachiteum TaxID=1324776 RepID=A0AAD6MZ45_9EURO|nr:hypothetical protein N7493_002867 [Penicillium malachiteum]
MWSFGLVWLFFVFASITKIQKFPFNIGWWGFTFPLGVYAASTIQAGAELNSKFFQIIGMILALFVVLLWIIISIGTLRRVISGRLFFAPCLADLRVLEEDKKAGKTV